VTAEEQVLPAKQAEVYAGDPKREIPSGGSQGWLNITQWLSIKDIAQL